MPGIQIKGRIAVIHPHATLRTSLKDLIQCEVGYSVVLDGDCSNASADDLVRAAADLIITEAESLRVVTELTTVLVAHQHLRSTPILVLSPSDEIIDIASAFRLGAKGYIPLNEVPLELMDAIGCLIAGQFYIGHALKNALPEAIIQEIFS
jgi:DNA-binding NarL/FixJ family response regulator